MGAFLAGSVCRASMHGLADICTFPASLTVSTWDLDTNTQALAKCQFHSTVDLYSFSPPVHVGLPLENKALEYSSMWTLP